MQPFFDPPEPIPDPSELIGGVAEAGTGLALVGRCMPPPFMDVQTPCRSESIPPANFSSQDAVRLRSFRLLGAETPLQSKVGPGQY